MAGARDSIRLASTIIMPLWIRLSLVTLFAGLWAIWIQPHTIFLRHTFLISGSLLGLYVIVNNRQLFWQKSVMPIYLIGLLLVWVAFHLVFLGSNFSLQLGEFLTIWKRVLIGFPFAIGLGIAIGAASSISLKENRSKYQGDLCWKIFFAGICAPTLIYLVRYVLTRLSTQYGLHVPDALLNLTSPSTWYVPKTGWVFFCLPALAIAWAKFLQSQRPGNQSFLGVLIYLLVVLLVIAVFYLENIKNGMIYSAIIIIVGLIRSAYNKQLQWTRKGLILLAVLLVGVGTLGYRHLEINRSWSTLLADSKVASQTEQIDQWKYTGLKGYPVNVYGEMVSITNYERVAWAKIAVEMIVEHPLGYGLIWKSFAARAKERWPDSNLTQSHSAWLDLTLGIGIPGVLLILLASFYAIKNLRQEDYEDGDGNSNDWRSPFIWFLGSILLLMCTTEVSQKNYIDALLFVILCVASISFLKTKND